MNTLLPASGIVCVALFAGCSGPPQTPPQQAAQPQQIAAAVPQPARPPKAAPPAPLTIDGYKREFAEHVAHDNPRAFDEPLPDVLKSIVVLDITIARDGRLARVAVYRSNHYKELETAALDSVRRAAPFAAPAPQLRRSDGSVNFLETFLFRDDGHFQIRSLANRAA